MSLHPTMEQAIAPFLSMTASVTPKDEYRGWRIAWDYGEFSATGPNYDASYEGPEDGWVDNGERVFARTREALIAEIDAWFDENERTPLQAGCR